jgi:hypothetical protein
VFAAASVLAAAGIAVFYVQRRLTRRLSAIGDPKSMMKSPSRSPQPIKDFGLI